MNITLVKFNGEIVSDTYKCTADGSSKCDYFDGDGNLAFSLLCECALTGGNTGYCPLPGMREMTDYIDAIKKIWYADTCHTYDRDNLRA